MKIKLDNPMFQTAIPLLKEIESHSYEAYFVGGCVRDTLLGKELGDIDIATSAFPEEIQQIFPRHFDVGKEHGTIVVLFQNEAYEVTTFRTESTYTDYRRPDKVKFVRSLKEDTLRRDFTINAMAIDAQGRLFDYHGGLNDLEAETIRAVGTASERFEEDALRMMRAIRFASQLGFKLESETFQAIQSLAPLLSKISIERIRIEFDKMLRGSFLAYSIERIIESTLLNHFPLAQHYDYASGLKKLGQGLFEKKPSNEPNGSRQSKILKVREQISEIQAWALLIKALGIVKVKEQKSFMKKWTHSNNLIQAVTDFIHLDGLIKNKALTPWSLYPFSKEIVAEMTAYLEMQDLATESDQLKEMYEQLPIKERKELALNGKDLLQHLPIDRGGPIIGAILLRIEQAVVERRLENEPEVLIAASLRIYEDFEG